MKNFLLGLLISILYMYVLFPIFFVGLGACLWMPMFFEFRGAVVVGIVTTVSTLFVIGIIDYKLGNDYL